MTVHEEMKVFAYHKGITHYEDIINTYENLIMDREEPIKFPTLMEYRKAIIMVERYYSLIREITGEEITS